ncbi:MAG: hypothetical protein IPP07_25420 [Holophagales bacterium]|jgi:hypothetical protein|nr:hypothetical protein [Holophagales bacterium]MBK9968027.1 hypothetical protein [Holophagales bacterium]
MRSASPVPSGESPSLRRATATAETIPNEPFPVTPAMVARAIREADAIGRAWKAVPT